MQTPRICMVTEQMTVLKCSVPLEHSTPSLVSYIIIYTSAKCWCFFLTCKCKCLAKVGGNGEASDELLSASFSRDGPRDILSKKKKLPDYLTFGNGSLLYSLFIKPYWWVEGKTLKVWIHLDVWWFTQIWEQWRPVNSRSAAGGQCHL